MSTISLVYISRARDAMTKDELAELLAKARKANHEKNVTGMLLYRNKFFIQVLEGESDVVIPLFEKISKDPRHYEISVLTQTPVSKRTFEQWEMGFNVLDEQHTVADLDGYSDFLQNPQSSYFLQKPNRAKVLLESFKNQTLF